MPRIPPNDAWRSQWLLALSYASLWSQWLLEYSFEAHRGPIPLFDWASYQQQSKVISIYDLGTSPVECAGQPYLS